jgi:hypothetical protein
VLRGASLAGLLVAAPAVLVPASVGPARVVNARVELRAAASGLEREVRALVGSRPGAAVWIGYEVPANRRRQSCCWSSADEASGAGGCRLEAGKGAFRSEPAEPLPLEGGLRLRVLLRAEGGRIGRVRAFSDDCWLDVGGLSLLWIEGVRSADSVGYLYDLASDSGSDTGGRPWHLGDGAIAAIAFHEDPAADAALERLAAPGQPTGRRRQAAFWMGEARGARGFETLSRLVREDADPRFREHVVFALTQSDEPKAIEAIIGVARRDESPRVRGQALFWLGQTASRRAADAIETALESDPEIEVKKKAVFALSQLPSDEGVPHLIRVARSHRSREVRRQAMFWLGQSGDPRALAFFEEILRP